MSTVRNKKDVKLCKNCQHCFGIIPFGWEFVKCAKVSNPDEYDVDAVSGAKIRRKPATTYCSILRKYSDDCGPSGRWFTPRRTILSFFFPS